MILLVGNDVSISLVQDSTMVFLTRKSDLGWGGCSVFGSMIVSRTVLHENMIVACSRLLIVIRSEDLVLRCFRVLSTMESDYCTKH